MNVKWKNKLVVFCLVVFIAAVLFYYQSFQDKPALSKIPFIFLFIAYVAFFPLAIIHESPPLSRCAYQFNRRAPPLN